MSRRNAIRRTLPRRASLRPVGPGRGLLRPKSDAEVELMALAGEFVVGVHRRLAPLVLAGITTAELDAEAERFIAESGAVSSFLGHQGFPKSICTSVNEVIIHGIPGDQMLGDGDVISIDVGVILDGFHGDAAWTYPVGEIPDDVRRLLRGTEAALDAAVNAAQLPTGLSAIGRAVERTAGVHGLGIVRDYGGHGIGRAMWEEPHVPNNAESADPIDLFPNLTLAIEPMFTLGAPAYVIEADGWTVRTVDRSFAAHFEHDVVVQPEGPPRVLTAALANVLH